DIIEYIVREDAIRQLLKLIFNRTFNSDSHIDYEYRQFKLNLPMKLNDLHQTIKKLNGFKTLDQFYIDFHAKEVIDERLNKICKKIQDHLNLHSCITRVALKMIGEHFNGTILIPFLNEFNKIPRFISIIDIFDDLITSGLISTIELLVLSKLDIIIKKSSLLKHFESISFFHKRDADLL
ncbi:unnamed protein product, partial [Rotaria sp. Silwood1]